MFAGGDRLEVQRMLSETQRMLENTREFLRHTHKGDHASRDYIEGLQKNLENEQRRLKHKLDADGHTEPEE